MNRSSKIVISRHTLCALSLLTLAGAAGSVEAAPSATVSRAVGHTLLFYGKVGGLVPFNDLSPFVSFRLGAGYVPPVLSGRLGFIVDLGYTQNSSDRSIDDPRVGQTDADGKYSYTLIQRDLNLFLGPQVFIFDPRGRWVPYAAIGLDLHFVRWHIEGEGGGNPLGGNDETSTLAGFAARGGCGMRLGPGLLTFELAFSWGPVSHQAREDAHLIPGDTHLGRFAFLAGYTATVGL